jgi:3-dehydroquinate synthase
MIVPIKIENKNDVEYNIYIEPLKEITFDNKVAIVTNPTVAKYHLQTALNAIKAPQVEVVEIPDGEEYKNIDTVLAILDRLFDAKFDRKSTLVALGGGVIGDMTGFSASLYQRGISFVQMPTTLLAQVDASVGGKTGVNNSYGKNLIGSFYQPKAVYIDPAFLDTLPKREFAAGVAEVIKMAVMFDRDFFEFLQKSDLESKDSIIEMIAKSVSLKASVVNQDEKESGIRAVLNYGHTFGHVVENLTNYTKYLHGEAVAIGIVMANELAVRLNLLSKEDAASIKELLIKNSLPVTFKIDSVEEFYEHFFLDKKSSKGQIAFILPNGKIGSHIIKRDIDKSIVLDALSAFKEGN